MSKYEEFRERYPDLFNQMLDAARRAIKEIIPKLKKERGEKWYETESLEDLKEIILSNATGEVEELLDRFFTNVLSRRRAGWEIDDELDWWDMYLFAIFTTHTEKRMRISIIKNLLRELGMR
ncbi:MAG: hypothetical protein HWN65_10695 [Candidatus Helarchaeota archaeon]|nr:hypothetical protein [Candidatus Helarchaeota archaeon]